MKWIILLAPLLLPISAAYASDTDTEEACRQNSADFLAKLEYSCWENWPRSRGDLDCVVFHHKPFMPTKNTPDLAAWRQLYIEFYTVKCLAAPPFTGSSPFTYEKGVAPPFPK
jgi:hypothetical protein